MALSTDYSDYFDRPEDFEPRHPEKSEDFDAHYLARIKRFPPLSPGEEHELWRLWRQFRDARARDRIARAYLRLVPPIARRVARRFDFEPRAGQFSPRAHRLAMEGYRSLLGELIAEGNLALVEALDHFDVLRAPSFAPYAQAAIRHAVTRRARSLQSIVATPWGERVSPCVSLDGELLDPMPFWDYCGSRATASWSDGDTQARRTQLRPAPLKSFRDLVPIRAAPARRSDIELLDLFRRGASLAEIAAEMKVSVSTVWRRKRSALERLSA